MEIFIDKFSCKMLFVYLDTMLSLTAIKQNLTHQYVAEQDGVLYRRNYCQNLLSEI